MTPSQEINKRYSLPTGLFFKLVEIAQRERISVKEVEITLLRRSLEKHYGFKCEHPAEMVRVSRGRRQAYCSWCWTYLEAVTQTVTSPYVAPRKTFTPKRSFFDKKQQEEPSLEGLRPDQRGGE